MAKFDKAIWKLNKIDFQGYTGNPPSNETEYNEVKDEMFSANAPTWSQIQTEMDNIPDRETLVASAKAKLMAGEALTQEEADTIVL